MNAITKHLPEIREAKRILVLKPDGIGDVVLATGFLRSLRSQCPDAQIIIAASKTCAELVDDRLFCDEVRVWKDRWRVSDWRAHLDAAWTASLKWFNRRPDWVLIPRSCIDYYSAAVYARWSGGKYLCAHKSFCQGIAPTRERLVNRMVRANGILHEVEYHRHMLNYLGLSSNDIAPQINIPAPVQDRVDNILQGFQDKSELFALGIGSGHPSKCWALENFKALANQLIQIRPQLKIVILGGKSEMQLAVQLNAERNDKYLNMAGRLSLLENAALLRKCAIYIGNDTGIKHLAAAVGCPVVEISKHPKNGILDHYESPARFGTYSKAKIILQPDSAAPECAERCCKSFAHCINGVTVETVLQATLELVSSNGQAPQVEALLTRET